MSFKDPIAPKKREPKEGKISGNFVYGEYDKRTGFHVSAGVDYGEGHRQPVGKKGNPASSDVIPQKSRCFSLDEIQK